MAGSSVRGGSNCPPLFVTEKPTRMARYAYRLFASTVLAGVLLVWLYRATHVPPMSSGARWWAWLGLSAAELWFGFYWVLTLSVRWSPVFRRAFPDQLLRRYKEEQLPGVDIFVCTADPTVEPPMLVISTVLSVMAYDYPKEKLNIYLSDDAGSIITLYALYEASEFAKHWLPFCNKYQVEPRSPAAYFGTEASPPDACDRKEWFSLKEMHKDLAARVNSVVNSGKIPEVSKCKLMGFSRWSENASFRDHPSIVQILIDGNKRKATDVDGKVLPTLVYMAREKRPQEHHHFKAGSLNALIRVSSVISNSPVIMNVDCDMYSNNSGSIRDALCFFQDEQLGQDIAFVQYPQNFENVVQNDIYGNPINTVNELDHPCLDGWGGMCYYGTGCFHRREALCGRIYSPDYKEDWTRVARKTEDVIDLEGMAESLVTCTYEHNTLWGVEKGVIYGCPLEDVITGLQIQCRGWRSVYHNPPRKGFLGMAPTSLGQILVQHKRWTEGFLQISLSKYSPFLLGHRKISLGLQMGYSVCGFWAANSFPTLYYVTIPSLCFLNGISLFPEITSPWFVPFAYVAVAAYSCSLVESLQCGDTAVEWWNAQRMWLFRRITSYLLAAIDTIRRMLGVTESGFTLTAKVTDPRALERYKKGMMEFGSFSVMFAIITTVALLNLACMMLGVAKVLLRKGAVSLGAMFVQAVLCALIVAINFPVYEAMFVRKDSGRLPASVSVVSLCIVLPFCILPTKL
ncbi:cellulose synthase-like protein E2 [Zea mays]|uniref:Cellulose synthase-like protein E1 n=2 Tax=Zea mays TaxID=4577 RepID=A0A1D6HJ04_MAIZE|nr:cellulose synthase-like protein E2 [Zea mays]AQK74473.1 Cellulose synthase-like protein E1 [Zea mays]|eukprot:XP_020394267.1 cellulose synthase-like protein E2 [Zea mays]